MLKKTPRKHNPFLVGIAGGTASGKTSVSWQLCETLKDNAVLIDMNSYYRDLSALPLAERRVFNFDHPDAFDVPLLQKHIDLLLSGQHIDKPSLLTQWHLPASRAATMAEAQKTETPAEAPKATTKKVFCFVSKREMEESDAIEMPYTNGQKVWVGKMYVKFGQAAAAKN